VEAVRPAQDSDRDSCTQLLEQALAAVATMRGGPALAGPVTAPQLIERWFDPQPTSALFVGEFHEVVMGLLAVTTYVRPGADAPTGRIDCCYVEQEARGVGVGSALMEAGVQWCEAHSCADIDARALPGDRNTKQRLEAAGFTARLLTLNRRLR
jgi:GNAT superfamily N-acetyltransferase